MKRLKEGDVRSKLGFSIQEIVDARAALQDCFENGPYSFPVRELNPTNLLSIVNRLILEASTLLQEVKFYDEQLNLLTEYKEKRQPKTVQKEPTASVFEAVFCNQSCWNSISVAQNGRTSNGFTLELIYKSGQLPLLNRCYQGAQPFSLRPEYLQQTLWNQHWNLVEWTIKKYDCLPEGTMPEIMYQCAKQKNLDVLEWLYSKGHVHTFNFGCALDTAVAVGDIRMAEFLQGKGYFPCDTSAKEKSNFQWEHQMPNLVELFQEEVVKVGSIEVLKWLEIRTPNEADLNCRFRRLFLEQVDRRYDLPAHMKVAASHGNLEMLEVLLRYVCLKDPRDWERTRTCADCLAAASRHGKLKTVEWLQRHAPSPMKCARDTNGHDALEAAAQNGHLNVVKWLYKNPPPMVRDDKEMWGILSIDLAAKMHHNHVVDWLCAFTDLPCTSI